MSVSSAAGRSTRASAIATTGAATDALEAVVAM